jgi:AcrR family transcriptional regulator
MGLSPRQQGATPSAAQRSGRSRRDERRADEIARRRNDILAAAASVFAAKGYHDAQISDIAAAAEVSRASIYSIFEGKQELYSEVISTAAKAIDERVHAAAARLDDPADQLLSVIDTLFECYEANLDLLRIYALGTHGLRFKAREVIGDSSTEIFVAFTNWVVTLAQRAKQAGYLRGHDPEAVAVSLVGAVTTMGARWVEFTPERPISQAVPVLRAIFRDVVGAAPESSS